METYKLAVNYNRSIAEALKAGGYRASGFITDENFPSDEEGVKEAEFELFMPLTAHGSFDWDITHQVSIIGGLRLATMKELLAFGEKYPELAKKFAIAELGSTAECEDGKCFGQIRPYGEEIIADTQAYGYTFSSDTRFLVVRVGAQK